MKKMYIQKGKIYYMNKEEQVYFCGTYLVSIAEGSPEATVVSGLIPDTYSFLDEEKIVKIINIYKKLLVKDFKTRRKIRPKAIKPFIQLLTR